MLRRPSFDIEEDFSGDELHDTYNVRSLTVTYATSYERSQLSVFVFDGLWHDNASLGEMEDHAVLGIKEFNVLRIF